MGDNDHCGASPSPLLSGIPRAAIQTSSLPPSPDIIAAEDKRWPEGEPRSGDQREASTAPTAAEATGAGGWLGGACV